MIIFVIIGIIKIKYFRDFLKGKVRGFKELEKAIKELLVYSLPFLPLSIWFIWHKAVSGWWFVMPYYQDTFANDFSFIKMQRVFQFFFLSQSRWLINALGKPKLFPISRTSSL